MTVQELLWELDKLPLNLEVEKRPQDLDSAPKSVTSVRVVSRTWKALASDAYEAVEID